MVTDKLTTNIFGVAGIRGELSIPKVIVRGAASYEDLHNLPTINGVTLIGNMTFEDLGLGVCPSEEIDNLFNT